MVLVVTGEDVSENKDGGVLKSRIRNGNGVNPPKDGSVCSGRFKCQVSGLFALFCSFNGFSCFWPCFT